MPSLMPTGKQQYFFPGTGLPLAGGKLYTYAAGTSAPKLTYQDAAGATPNPNPVPLDASGSALIFWDGSYKIVLKDAVGNTIYTVDNYADPAAIINIAMSALQLADYAALRAFNGSQNRVYITGYLATAKPSGVAGVFVRDDTDHASADNGGTILVDVLGHRWKRVFDGDHNPHWFGARGGGVDDSIAINAACSAIEAVGGGTLNFPFDIYSFYLDRSNKNKFLLFKGNFSTFRPADSRLQPAIVYCDNSGASGGFQHTYTQWDHCFFDAQNTSDYCVQLTSSCADFRFCNFSNAKVAGFRGVYAQYCRFESPVFGSNNFSATTWGCYLTGPDGAHRSNEVWFERPQFLSNANGLYLGGCEKTRVSNGQFQDTKAGGTAALQVHTDLAGNSSRATDIVGCWFEINQVPAILIGTAEGTNIERNFLVGTPTMPCIVQSVTSYDLRFTHNSQLSNTTVTFAHPGPNTDTASVTIDGGNIWPVLNLDHAGPTIVYGKAPATGMRRSENLLMTTGQTDSNSVPIVFVSDWNGAKTSVPKNTPTPLFQINQKAYNTPAYRVALLNVELRTWDNTNASSQFGYSGHVQQFEVFISDNNTGAPQISIAPVSNGIDLGISTSWQAPGPLTLTAAAANDTVTFSASWAGVGNGIASTNSQTFTYMLRGAATNSLYMTRL